MNPYFNRLIQRFTVLYGQQKVASVFAGTPEQQEATAQAWEEQLRRTDVDVIKSVLNHLAEGGMDWPPNLAEWTKLCKQFRHEEHRPALLPPPKHITEAGREIIESAVSQMRTAGFDYLHWAKYPKSAQAILEISRGARTDSRLADILAQHIADGGANCQPEAQRQLVPIIEKHRMSLSV